MSTSTPHAPYPAVLPQSPEARTLPIEDLTRDVLQGKIRVPDLQRAFKWRHSDVLKLLDSVLRGYPIGTLLFWRRPAPATSLRLGPLALDAPERGDALWVVDGQQRLTSLCAALKRTTPPAAPDVWSAWYDPRSGTFKAQDAPGEPLVPTWELGDSARLLAWLRRWPWSTDDALVERVLQASRRLREYPIPLYIVESEDSGVLREIFQRINQSGRPLERGEVFDALIGTRDNSTASLAEIQRSLLRLGWGMPETTRLSHISLAIAGRNVTQGLEVGSPEEIAALQHATEQLEPALTGVVALLRDVAEIPHHRLLPYPVPLLVLGRFFALHPAPSHRSRQLLARWVWRGALSGVHIHDQRVRLRAAVAALEEHAPEELNVQHLLRLTPREAPEAWKAPEGFALRAAQTCIGLCGAASLRPRDLRTGEQIELTALLDADASPPIQHLDKPAQLATALLHPRLQRPLEALRGWAKRDLAHPVLTSHGVDPVCAAALLDRDLPAALAQRERTLERAVNDLGARLAGWGLSDHAPLAFYLDAEGDDDP